MLKNKQKTNKQQKQKTKIFIQAVIQAELGQYVQINLFDKDEASDDEILGRWDPTHKKTFHSEKNTNSTKY